MAVPFVSTLTPAARIAFPIIEGGVARGLSANAIETSLRATGMGIRRQTLLDIVRRVRNVDQVGAQLRNIRRGFIPDPRRIPEALTKLRRAFSFRVQLTGIDSSTGDRFTRFVNVALNQPATRQSIENQGLAFVMAEPQRYQMVVDEVLLVSGVKAGGEGTLL